MQFRKRVKKQIGLEMTPLIDVVFLLLIFFMLTTTFMQNPEIRVDLPDSGAKPSAKPPRIIEISISKDHHLHLQGKAVPASRLKTALEILIRHEPRPLLIMADGKARHEMVVYVMDQASQVGISQISVATEEKRK